MEPIENLKKVRLDKLSSIKKLGVNPYPATFDRTHTAVEAAKNVGGKVCVAGRLMAIREHGKSTFADLVDGTGKIQIYFKEDVVGAEQYEFLKNLDIGDFVGASGEVFKTHLGETTVRISSFTLLSKSLRPLPEKWHGLRDVEERYRQRYVDLLVNPGVREVFEIRTKVVKFLRAFLDKDGFLEVETPVLQPIYGGASAKPFTTHHNVLDSDLFLRISDELYLKRLIVAGFERVYEIGKDFRNEGMDREHNPEFTMLEFYWAYADYEKLMKYTEEMLSSLVKEIKGSYRLTFEGQELDFKPPWGRKTYRDAVLEYAGIDINKADNEEKLSAEINQKNIKLDMGGVVGYGALLDTLYKTVARTKLIGPMFLIDRPTEFVTLAKRLPEDPKKTASFQLLVYGKELINAYNELNDPQDQAERWRESEKLGEKGKEEHEAFDYDYIRALEYGMPPTAGWGFGIDRFVSILTDQHTIKDVILFPIMKPEKGER